MKTSFFIESACRSGIIATFIAMFFACSSGSSNRSAETADMQVTVEDQQQMINTAPVINGHEYVDLGLSVKWATMNIGAVTAWDYGEFFAWGEIRPKEIYSPKNSVTYTRNINTIARKPQYDAALANWGDPWRMPSKQEYSELLENCTIEKSTLGDASGYLLTSKINGNTIFFPAAGAMFGRRLTDGTKNSGFYWSSSTDSDGGAGAFARFGEGQYETGIGIFSRYEGMSVRAVTE